MSRAVSGTQWEPNFEWLELAVVGDVDCEVLMLALEIVGDTSAKERFGAEIMGRIALATRSSFFVRYRTILLLSCLEGIFSEGRT